MTFLAQWSGVVVLASVAAAGVAAAHVLAMQHVREVKAAPNWMDRNQRFAEGEQALRRTRQWLFGALWIAASVLLGPASALGWLSYIAALVLTNRMMRRLLVRFWDDSLAGLNHCRSSPFAGESASRAIQAGYGSYFVFVVYPPGVLWVVAGALLVFAINRDLEREYQLDHGALFLPNWLSNPDTSDPHGGKVVLSTRVQEELTETEAEAWTQSAAEIERHQAIGRRLATGQKLVWFAFAVVISRRTASGEPLLAMLPVVQLAIVIAIHQLGNHEQRRLHRVADQHGRAAAHDDVALGHALEKVANVSIAPLLTSGRGTPSWWSRMEAVGHTPNLPAPPPLTLAPAARMIGTVSVAMLAAASMVMPLAHAADPEVEAAVVLGTGQRPSTTWGGIELVRSVDELLRQGQYSLSFDNIEDQELRAEIQRLAGRLGIETPAADE